MKYIIGNLAQLLGVSTNTVRRYEEMGYIKSIRDEDNGYRYYDEEAVNEIMEIRLKRKYGFTHQELEAMKNYDIGQEIAAYEKKLQDLDERVAYMTYLRNRLNGDIRMMKKLDEFAQPGYVRDCVDFTYVLYQSGKHLNKENVRLQTIQDFLYKSPEVQRVIILRKDDIERKQIVLHMGWAMKTAHMEKYQVDTNIYTERYEKQKSVMTLTRITVDMEELAQYSNDDLWKLFLSEPWRYIHEQNMCIKGDVLGVVICSAMENNHKVTYVLTNVPFGVQE